MISSFGMVPCSSSEKPMSTHGRYGAEKTSRPRKLRRVFGSRRLQMYTRLDDSGEPRKGIDTSGDSSSSDTLAYSSSHAKRAGERPDESSSRRE